MHCLHHRLPATTCEHYICVAINVGTTDLSVVVTPDSHPTITDAPSVAQLASLLMSTVTGAFVVSKLSSYLQLHLLYHELSVAASYS